MTKKNQISDSNRASEQLNDRAISIIRDLLNDATFDDLKYGEVFRVLFEATLEQLKEKFNNVVNVTITYWK